MSLDQLQAKIDANEGYTGLLRQAAACAKLYDKAQLPYPEELSVLFGYVRDSSSGNGHAKPQKKGDTGKDVSERPYNVPSGINEDWVSIPLIDVSPSSLILAHLKKSGMPIRARDLFEVVSKIHPDTVQGTVANIGTRLVNDGIVERADDGWRLLKPELAGEIIGDRFWAPANIMAKAELTANRREAIIHLLRHFKSGLQIVQIVERLRELAWVKAPINKDLLKGDVQVLEQEKIIKHAGNSKKWVLGGGGPMTERAAD